MQLPCFELMGYIYKECREVNRKHKQLNPDYPVTVELLQMNPRMLELSWCEEIAEFYSMYRKNKAFIHRPDKETALFNGFHYPIIIERENETGNILAISTIKYDENTEDNINPYYPIPGAKYFAVTGLLAREDNVKRGYPGLGSEIEQIAVKSIYEYHKKHQDIGLMAEVDIRNKASFAAYLKALKKVDVGENAELKTQIRGYYELRDFATNNLTEVQTLIFDTCLDPQPIEITPSPKHIISLEGSEFAFDRLVDSVEEELRVALSPYGLNKITILPDADNGNVVFRHVEDYKHCHVENFQIEPHYSAMGNDCVPEIEEEQVLDRKVLVYEQ